MFVEVSRGDLNVGWHAGDSIFGFPFFVYMLIFPHNRRHTNLGLSALLWFCAVGRHIDQHKPSPNTRTQNTRFIARPSKTLLLQAYRTVLAKNSLKHWNVTGPGESCEVLCCSRILTFVLFITCFWKIEQSFRSNRKLYEPGNEERRVRLLDTEFW